MLARPRHGVPGQGAARQSARVPERAPGGGEEQRGEQREQGEWQQQQQHRQL